MPNTTRSKNIRRVALGGGAVYALSQALAYMPWLRNDPVQEPIIFATLDGALLPVWAALWGLVAIVCAASIPRAHLRYGFAPMVGLMFAWGTIWFIGWLGAPGTPWWQIAFSYAGPALIIGALMGHGQPPKEK